MRGHGDFLQRDIVEAIGRAAYAWDAASEANGECAKYHVKR
jgi:hypothetical protein